MPEHRGNVARRPRGLWSGTISFGLVSIPVELFAASRRQHISLRMLDSDGTPLSRRYFCPAEDREIDGDEIVRGYEVEKGEFVIVTDEELESLAPEKSRDIDLRRFVDRTLIDPIFFERAWFLVPGDGSTKAYRLLADTMESANRAGIATFVMRGKEYLVAILAGNGLLRAETLRFADEVRTPGDIELPEPVKPKAAVVKRMEKAVRSLTEKSLDPDELEDRYLEKLRELVTRKQKKGEDVLTPGTAVAENAGEETDVIDIMEVLKRRLGEAGGKSEGRAQHRRGGSGSTRRSEDAGGDDDLRGRTREELYERARKLDIEGRSGMSKAQLIRAIRRSA